MLFPTEAVLDARAALYKRIEEGEEVPDAAWSELLELDPDDGVALFSLGRRLLKAGDTAAAEALFWRAAVATPQNAPVHFALAEIARGRKEEELAAGLVELGLRKILLEDDESEYFSSVPEPPVPPALEGLSRRDKFSLAAQSLEANREKEPPEVAGRLRPYRLAQDLLEQGDLETELVDDILAAGPPMVPLLVGLLRVWAQELVSDDAALYAENVLALLGETGDAGVIPPVIEFTTVEDPNVSGAAGWALDRIIERDPEGAVKAFASVAAEYPVGERRAIVERLMRHPELSGTGAVLERLTMNLDSLSKEDLGEYLRVLVAAEIALRGKAGIEVARALLRRNGGRVSRSVRAECEALIEICSEGPIPPAETLPRSPWTVYDICGGNAVWDAEEDEEAGLDDRFDEDDVLELPPSPVHVEKRPGRNDPCWCGSGKKYKKCHLDSDQHPAAAPSDSLDAVRGRLRDFLPEIVPPKKSVALFESFFTGIPKSERSAEPLVDWLIHDYVVPELGRTVMEEFLLRHGASLKKREREMVESWAHSHLSFYTAIRVREGTGLELQDLLTGEQRFVHDVSTSKSLIEGDGFLARVVQGERGWELTGAGLSLRRDSVDAMRSWLEEDKSRSGLSWQAYFKRNLPRVRRRVYELHAEWVAGIRLANTSGEEFVLSKAVYRVLENEAVERALDQCRELTRDDEQWIWKNSEDKILGTIRIEGAPLVLECNSKERLARGRAILEKAAGSLLEHVRDDFTSQDVVKKIARSQGASKKDERGVPPEVGRAVVLQYLEQHYAKWPDMSLPALDGMTPREAVKTARGRERVSALLRDMERQDERRGEDETRYDFNKLRDALGLKR